MYHSLIVLLLQGLCLLGVLNLLTIQVLPVLLLPGDGQFDLQFLHLSLLAPQRNLQVVYQQFLIRVLILYYTLLHD